VVVSRGPKSSKRRGFKLEQLKASVLEEPDLRHTEEVDIGNRFGEEGFKPEDSSARSGRHGRVQGCLPSPSEGKPLSLSRD